MKKLIILGVAILGLTACAETSGAPSQGLAFMTRAELLAEIPGRTVENGEGYGDVKWSQTYSEGGESGTIAVIFDGAPSVSAWSLNGDLWCEDWGDDSACWALAREGEGVVRPYTDGTERREVTWLIK